MRIELRQLSKSFDSVEAVDSVDLEIDDGEFVAFLGPSGCGKTTLLRSIAGLEQIDGGRVHIGEAVDRAGVMLRTGEGARLGWMTGCLAFVASIVFTAINFALVRASGTNIREILRQSMEKMPTQDPAARQVMEFLTSTSGLTIFIVVYVIFSFVVMSSLAAAGGALGAKVMEKE